jgi:hypothetical protein
LPAGIEPAGAGGPASAAPANPFPVTPGAGPWLVCAATYVGPDGAELSHQMALELRNRHGMTAYIYNRGDEERRKQEQEWEEQKKRYPGAPVRRRGYRVQDQYAVLVGNNFKDFAAASAFLPKVKNLPMPDLKLVQVLMLSQETDPKTRKAVVKRVPVNPFQNALVVHNPTVPNTLPPKPKWDPFWKKLNAEEEYSLLKNPKAYTLLVKEYSGAQIVQDQKASGGFLSALGLGGAKPGEALNAAAAQAHALAEFLAKPQFGFKTWVLHMRYSSAVCVGGFDGPDDPELQRVARRLSTLRFSAGNTGADPIGLLPNPIPVEVPRP